MFDEAVMAAGTFIQNRLDERDKKHKPRWTFDQIIRGHAMAASPGKKQKAKDRWKAAFGQAMR